MGGVPVKHHTKSKVGRRRSHHALKRTNLVVCKHCKAPVLSHRVCSNCGRYGGEVKVAPKGEDKARKKEKK